MMAQVALLDSKDSILGPLSMLLLLPLLASSWPEVLAFPDALLVALSPVPEYDASAGAAAAEEEEELVPLLGCTAAAA